jgi:hypothetical protein
LAVNSFDLKHLFRALTAILIPTATIGPKAVFSKPFLTHAPSSHVNTEALVGASSAALFKVPGPQPIVGPGIRFGEHDPVGSWRSRSGAVIRIGTVSSGDRCSGR